MKRMILGIFLLLMATGPLQAKAPWGALPQVDVNAPHTAVDDPLTILKRLTSGQPVNVYINQQIFHDGIIDYLSFLEKIVNYWFDAATSVINQSGQSEQFPEVLKHLGHKANLRFVGLEKLADLRVLVTDVETVHKMCGNDVNSWACVFSAHGDGTSPQLIIPDVVVFEKAREEMGEEEWDWTALLLHEFGHIFGLSDQYGDADDASHPIYRSTDLFKGLMHHNAEITCDDIDGLINLIDIIYGTEPTRKGGWPSLCGNSKDVYANGRVLGSGNFVFESFMEETAANLYTFLPNGELEKKGTFPFVETNVLTRIPDRQILQKDHMGRPLHATGPAGEDIYYMYDYGLNWRLITKDGKALRVEESGLDNETGYMGINYHFLAPKNQRKATLSLQVLRGQGGGIWYYEQELTDSYSGNYVFVLKYEIDARGQIKNVPETDGNLPPAAQLEDAKRLALAWGKEQLQARGRAATQRATQTSTAGRKSARKQTQSKQQVQDKVKQDLARSLRRKK